MDSATFARENNDKPFKISWTSAQRLKESSEIVSKKIDETLNNILPPEKSQLIKTRFVQTYLKTLEENLVAKNLLQQSLNQSMVYGQSSDNCERRAYLNEVLLPKIGKLMSEVASKRKLYPKVYCQIINKRLKLERHNLKTHEVKVENKFLQKLQDSLPNDKSFEDELRSCCNEVKSFNMKVQTSIDELHELKVCQSRLEKMSSNRINRVLFAPSPLPLGLNLNKTDSDTSVMNLMAELKETTYVPSFVNSNDCS